MATEADSRHRQSAEVLPTSAGYGLGHRCVYEGDLSGFRVREPESKPDPRGCRDGTIRISVCTEGPFLFVFGGL